MNNLELNIFSTKLARARGRPSIRAQFASLGDGQTGKNMLLRVRERELGGVIIITGKQEVGGELGSRAQSVFSLRNNVGRKRAFSVKGDFSPFSTCFGLDSSDCL